MNTLIRTIEVAGYKVEVHKFSYTSYYYPTFNDNAEFPVTSKGYRQLSRYLRTTIWLNNMYKEITSMIDNNK